MPLRNAAKYKGIPGGRLGEKIPPNYFYRFMYLRIVSALRPLAISTLAICCEYHTSDIPGRLPYSLRNAFRQHSCKS